MISIIVKIPIQEGKVEEFVEEFKKIAALVTNEEGNFLYSLSFNKKEPNIAVIMERYKDQAALDAHSATDYFKEFSGKMAAYVAGAPEFSFMEEVAAA